MEHRIERHQIAAGEWLQAVTGCSAHVFRELIQFGALRFLKWSLQDENSSLNIRRTRRRLSRDRLSACQAAAAGTFAFPTEPPAAGCAEPELAASVHLRERLPRSAKRRAAMASRLLIPSIWIADRIRLDGRDVLSVVWMLLHSSSAEPAQAAGKLGFACQHVRTEALRVIAGWMVVRKAARNASARSRCLAKSWSAGLDPPGTVVRAYQTNQSMPRRHRRTVARPPANLTASAPSSAANRSWA